MPHSVDRVPVAPPSEGLAVSAPDAIVDRLRRDILDGTFAPGERLVEADLCERYAAGRATIRAALVQLETEVLVDRFANRGAVVHRIRTSEAIEITEARMALEGLIAGRAARRANGEDSSRLRTIIDEMRAAVGANDGAWYSDLNRRLHADLREIAGHGVAADLVANLRNRGVQHQFRLSLMPGRQATSLGQHAAIVEAVVAGDEAAATAAMECHLGSVIEVLEQWVDA